MEKKKLTSANGRLIADNQNTQNRRTTWSYHDARPLVFGKTCTLRP